MAQYLHTQGRHSELMETNGKWWQTEEKKIVFALLVILIIYLTRVSLLTIFKKKKDLTTYFSEHFKKP